MLTGKQIEADEAKVLGLIDQVIDDNNIVDAALSYAKSLEESAPLALKERNVYKIMFENDNRGCKKVTVCYFP